MGGYYKIKKILLILIICLTILRIFKSLSFGADNVNNSWVNGNYTIMTDDNFLALQKNQLDIQTGIIMFFYDSYNKGNQTNVRNSLKTISNYMSNYSNQNTTYHYYIWFYISSVSKKYSCEIVRSDAMGTIINKTALLDNGYQIPSAPFYRVTRSSTSFAMVFNQNGTYSSVTTGTPEIPCAELGYYSQEWLDLFLYTGVWTNDNDYSTALYNINSNLSQIKNYEQTQTGYLNSMASDIEENNNLISQTNNTISNTYNYLTNDNIQEITSLGISQPQVTEQVDLTSVLDSLEALLTNETYTTKFFTITLPNGRGSTFALSPELLENNLTRVGGQNIVSIIHACWYIGLYGWYIFSLLAIYGKLLTGDLFHLVKGCSPVTNLVKMSVGTISGGRF